MSKSANKSLQKLHANMKQLSASNWAPDVGDLWNGLNFCSEQDLLAASKSVLCY